MASPETHCPTCVEPGTLLCAGCRDVKYCSVECQQTDWPAHKLLCKTFKDFQERPAPDMRRVIVFPENEKKPYFLWTAIKMRKGYQEVECEEELMKTRCDRRVIYYNPITLINVRSTMVIKYRDNFFGDGSKENMSVSAATDYRSHYLWGGPMLVLKGFATTGGNITEMHDLDMKDYSDVVAYFMDSYNDTPKNTARKGPKVRAVKATCRGERRLRGGKQFQPVKISASHPMFDSPSLLSSVSREVGMPLYTFRYAPDRNWTDCGDTTNQEITFMHLNCDLNGKFDAKTGTMGFGWAGMQWQNNVGNVLVARKNRKPLSARTLEAFGGFCFGHLVPLLEQMDVLLEDGKGNPAAKAAMLAEITPEKWEAFLTKWMSDNPSEHADDDPEDSMDDEDSERDDEDLNGRIGGLRM